VIPSKKQLRRGREMRLFSLFAAGLLGISICLAMGIISGSAAADPSLDPAEFALSAPGTIIEGRFQDGTQTKARIGEAGDFTYTYTDLIGDSGLRTRYHFCYSCDPEAFPIELERYRDLWPLEVGNKVKFQRKRASDGVVWIHKITVAGTETVGTELGSMDAFVVEEKVRGSAGNKWRGTAKLWFAPSVKWVVKWEWWSTSDGKHTWEITTITPPG
jgi:hypothetical protein